MTSGTYGVRKGRWTWWNPSIGSTGAGSFCQRFDPSAQGTYTRTYGLSISYAYNNQNVTFLSLRKTQRKSLLSSDLLMWGQPESSISCPSTCLCRSRNNLEGWELHRQWCCSYWHRRTVDSSVQEETWEYERIGWEGGDKEHKTQSRVNRTPHWRAARYLLTSKQVDRNRDIKAEVEPNSSITHMRVHMHKHTHWLMYAHLRQGKAFSFFLKRTGQTSPVPPIINPIPLSPLRLIQVVQRCPYFQNAVGSLPTKNPSTLSEDKPTAVWVLDGQSTHTHILGRVMDVQNIL